MALSASEDVLAIFLTWLATKHPYLAASIAIVLLILLVLAIHWIWRMLRRMYRRLMAGPNQPEASIQ
jgi:hypothetical protein